MTLSATRKAETIVWKGVPHFEQYDEILEALKRYNNDEVKVTLKVEVM